MFNPVLKTTSKVVSQSKNVRINYQKIQELAKEWVKENISTPSWDKDKHFESKDSTLMLTYFIILDSLNFCFWAKPPQEKWYIFYKGEKYDGYFALSLTLKKFFEDFPQKANFNYFSKISFKEFSSIFRGEGDLLFFKKRYQILKSVSQVFTEKYKSNPENFISLANNQFSKLIPKIVRDLPYFDDIYFFQGNKVYFLKRAQILGGDIMGAFNNKGIGYFKDLEYLTAFADYKLPQILNHRQVLEYSKKLEDKIKSQSIIKAGSREEIEIRSCTLWAVEYLKQELKKLGKSFYSFQIDWILWNRAQKEKMKLPYHLTKTIYY